MGAARSLAGMRLLFVLNAELDAAATALGEVGIDAGILVAAA